MKRIFLVAFCIIFIFLLASCSCQKEKEIENPLVRVVDGVKYSISISGDYYVVIGLENQNMTEVVIKSQIENLPVKTVGNIAFQGCDRIKSITVPNGIITIGEKAFANCHSLQRVIVGKDVTGISPDAFESCDSLLSIEVDEGSSSFKSIDGNLYTKDGKTLLRYAIGKTNGVFSVPQGVIQIGSVSFADADNLTKVILPNSVTTIGNYAFMSCYNLKSIEIPSSVTKIGAYAFSLNEMLTIYCQVNIQPDTWDAKWNIDECPVEWGWES